MEQKLLKICVWIVIIVTAIFTVLTYTSDSLALLKILSTVASISEILIVSYCNCLWKLINFLGIPRIYGEWKCSIIYEDKKTKKELRKETKVSIRQNVFNVRVNLDSDETNSYSILGRIETEHDRKYLVYVYKTSTKKEFREKNRDQLGSAKLMIKDVNNLEGEYWTNNYTNGRMQLIKNKKKEKE